MKVPGERILADSGEGYRKLQLSLDKLQRVSWIESLVAPSGWEVMSTFTFRWEASIESCRRCFERWIVKRLPAVTYFYAVEGNPSGREGFHIHSLWADAETVYRKAIWQETFKKWGRARVEPVRSKRDSSAYASKYLCKENAWWNVKLQWHRSQALRGEPFSLDCEALRPTPLQIPVPPPEFGFAREVFNLTSERPAAGCSEPAAVLDDSRQASLWNRREDGIWERSS
jgi:hypothetical protein